MFSSSGNGSSKSSPPCTRNFFVAAHFPDFLASNKLKPLLPQTAETFPSFAQFVGGLVTAPKPEKKQELFEALVGDARELFQELLEDPSRYETGVSEALQQLINGTKKFQDLEQYDRDLLNRATVDFATAKSPTPSRDRTAQPQAQAQAGGLPVAAQAAMGSFEREPELEWRDEGHPAPVIEIPDTPPSFWWRK